MRLHERILLGISLILVVQSPLSSASGHVHQHRNIDLGDHQHSRIHRRSARIAGRALAAGGAGTQPSSPVIPIANASPDQSANVPPGKEADHPAETVLDLLDDLYGDSIGTGPSDDWRELGEGAPSHGNPSGGSPPVNVAPAGGIQPPPNQPGQTVTRFETEVVWVTAVVEANNAGPSSAPPPAPIAPVPPPAVVNVPPKPAPPAPAPPVIVVPKPQPKPQPLANLIQPQTVAKPQPTQVQPAGSPDQASPVNTNGLPTEFVDNLSCDSPIYQGLSKLHHDIHRTNHSLSPLAWNDTLYQYAKETAQTCVYGHSLVAGGGGYGQNIAAGDAPGNISAVLTNMFYNAEIELFSEAIGQQWGNNQPDMSNFEKWGHATQMLWKTTTSFACFTATCSPPGADPLNCAADGTSYLKNVGCGNGGTRAFNTVCNYYPPGNYAGEYAAVPAPQGVVGFVQMTSDGVIGLH